MPLSLLYSGILHILFFSLLFFFAQGVGQNKKKQATYTIDFIGSSSAPMRYGTPEPKPVAASAEQPKQEVSAPAAPKEEAKQESQIKTEKSKETKKTYNSKAQISKDKQKKTNKTQTKTESKQEEKVVLSKPSILKEVQSDNIDVSGEHNLATLPGDRAVQASFTNFPYPWYITQVRNNLWTSWQKLMPKKKVGLSVLVSFNLDRNGAIYGVQIEKSSKNDDFDYKGKTAVLNSAPYPPLPKEYEKDILTVTVEFKNEE
jgi:TonB family protein